MTISMPTFPYSGLRDDRPPRLMSYSRLIDIVDRASECRSTFVDLFDRPNMLEALQRGTPQGIYWVADDSHFVTENGHMPGIEAYCDFENGTELYLREFTFNALFNEDPYCVQRQNGGEALAHELGHLHLRSHKRKVIARAKARGHGSKRAAHSSVEVRERTAASVKARNLDLEEEADCFAYAFLVPVKKLTGSLSFGEISQNYCVSKRVAYEAAMLAKD